MSTNKDMTCVPEAADVSSSALWRKAARKAELPLTAASQNPALRWHHSVGPALRALAQTRQTSGCSPMGRSSPGVSTPHAFRSNAYHTCRSWCGQVALLSHWFRILTSCWVASGLSARNWHGDHWSLPIPVFCFILFSPSQNCAAVSLVAGPCEMARRLTSLSCSKMSSKLPSSRVHLARHALALRSVTSCILDKGASTMSVLKSPHSSSFLR